MILFLLCVFGCQRDEETEPINLPKLGITNISNLTSKSLIANSAIIDNGNSEITEQGFVWDIEEYPTIDNNNYISSSSPNEFFKSYVTDLTPNNQYYIRSYAKNKAGIAYGEVTTFITKHHIYEGSINLESQTDVNNFGKEQYTKVKGGVVIRGTEITSLDTLSGLSLITGKLEIYSTGNLKNLNGLEKLDSVYVVYIYNTGLINIDGLSGLTSIYGDNYYSNISDNRYLTNIDGLSNVSKLKGIYIWLNESLKNIDGLQNVTNLSGLSILSNNNLNNIDGLINITSLNYLSIDNNMALTDLGGLKKITTIEKKLYIYHNPLLVDLEDLSNLKTVYDLEIENNDGLRNIDGLRNLQSIGYRCIIEENDALNDFCGFSPSLFSNSELIFYTSGNAYNPTKNDLMNNNCSKQ